MVLCFNGSVNSITVSIKEKKCGRYLGIFGISIYSCEVHGNVLGSDVVHIKAKFCPRGYIRTF
jgi:hypothetical protein